MTKKLLLVGELVVDVTLPTQSAPTKVRLGGIFHAARGAWSLASRYKLGYFAPAYLDEQANGLAKAHGAECVAKIGQISGTPNVMLAAEPTEAGDQGYEHLLSDHASYTLDEKSLSSLCSDVTDVLILAGNFDVAAVLHVLSKTGARVHLDIGSGPTPVAGLTGLGRPLATLFLSTSARCFEDMRNGVGASLHGLASTIADTVVLKENRGGSRLLGKSGVIEVGAQRRKIVHSIGVGDVFDVAYTSFSSSAGDLAALSYASWIAAEYAATTFPDDFKREVQRIAALSPEVVTSLPSIRLPWEARPLPQIYIAAPDFDYVDRRDIDRLAECLRYHNFSPRLPVRENGQATDQTTSPEKAALYQKDMELLGQCELLIAVNLFNDPGTFIEIGIAHARGVPVLLYDPLRRANNVMLVTIPELVSDSLDEIIGATFEILARKHAK